MKALRPSKTLLCIFTLYSVSVLFTLCKILYTGSQYHLWLHASGITSAGQGKLLRLHLVLFCMAILLPLGPVIYLDQ